MVRKLSKDKTTLKTSNTPARGSRSNAQRATALYGARRGRAGAQSTSPRAGARGTGSSHIGARAPCPLSPESREGRGCPVSGASRRRPVAYPDTGRRAAVSRGAL
eukprot:5352137-Prymnesium_polylepis.2